MTIQKTFHMPNKPNKCNSRLPGTNSIQFNCTGIAVEWIQVPACMLSTGYLGYRYLSMAICIRGIASYNTGPAVACLL